MQIEQLEEIASARRYAYTAFQRLTGNTPTQELFNSLNLDVLRMSFTVVDALPDTTTQIDIFFTQLQEALANLDTLTKEYARIFVGPTALPAPPWESVYRDNKRLLMTATTLSVRECYRAAGYEAQQRLHVPDDHLGIELDFLAALAQEVLDAYKTHDSDNAYRAFEMGTAFLKNHLGLWVADFAEELHKRDGSTFYCAVADALRIFVEADLAASNA